ncbi:ABC transporter substrate-binding protein [Microbacterium sp. 22215]|uniref:ABC transporter substrate-binding protein n=1 Tax=Microbacterium sp. 22215 TaxID=3453893 RepID=UPI003F83F572
MTQHRRAQLVRSGAIATTAIGALILAGCSGSAGDEGSGSSQEFSLAYAVSATEDNPYEILAKKYMEENPDVRITLNEVPVDTYGQTLTTQFNAGNASDLIQAAPGTGQGSSIIPLAKAGYLEALDGAATDLIPSGSEAQFQIDDKTYGLPLSISYAGTVVNETAREAAGTDFPIDFDQVLDTCASEVAAGRSLFSLAGAAAPNTGIMAMGISATRVYEETPDWNEQRADGKVTFVDSEGWADTLQTIVDMNDAGCFQPGKEGAGIDALIGGVVDGTSLAMFAPGGTFADLLRASPDQNFVVNQFPPANEGDKVFGLVSSNYALSLNANAKNKDAALAYLKWMEKPEQSQAFADAQGSLPVSGLEDYDFEGTAYEAVEDVVTSGSYVPLPNASWPNAAVYDALGTGVQGLLTGQRTVEQVLQSMDDAWGD